MCDPPIGCNFPHQKSGAKKQESEIHLGNILKLYSPETFSGRARALFNSERALVAARALVDEEFITDLGEEETTLIQIFCNGPHIIYADGLELGTADAARARGAVLHAA